MSKIAPLLTMVVGCVLGAWWGLHQAAPEALSVERLPPDAQAASVASMPVAVDAPALRAIIREELSAALRSREKATPAEPEAVAAPASPELLAKRHEAQEDINALIGGGVWGNEQRVEFQQKLLLLDPEQRDHAMQELVTRLNSGALKVETNGPPL